MRPWPAYHLWRVALSLLSRHVRGAIAARFGRCAGRDRVQEGPEGTGLSYTLCAGAPSVCVACSLRVHDRVWGRKSLARRFDPRVRFDPSERLHMETNTTDLDEGIGNSGPASRKAAHTQRSISARGTQAALESNP